MVNFQFFSGGAYHPKSFGAWSITLNDNSVSFSRQIQNNTTDFGTYNLTKSETKIWQLIKNANFESLNSSTRVGVPDEAKLSFMLSDKRLEIWVNDAREDKNLMAVIDFFSKLVKKYTKETLAL